MKNPVVCTIVFVIGVGILSYAYWMVTRGVKSINIINKIGVPIALGCVATFLIFWSVSGFMIRIFTSIKSVYYKGVNSFVLRQFCSKINTTVFSTTVICIMLFYHNKCAFSSTFNEGFAFKGSGQYVSC